MAAGRLSASAEADGVTTIAAGKAKKARITAGFFFVVVGKKYERPAVTTTISSAPERCG
jgi:hypothetical protein